MTSGSGSPSVRGRRTSGGVAVAAPEKRYAGPGSGAGRESASVAGDLDGVHVPQGGDQAQPVGEGHDGRDALEPLDLLVGADPDHEAVAPAPRLLDHVELRGVEQVEGTGEQADLHAAHATVAPWAGPVARARAAARGRRASSATTSRRHLTTTSSV